MTNSAATLLPGHAAMIRVKIDLEAIANSAPEWYAKFEQCDPDICDIEDLLELMDTSPNDTARGFLVAKYLFREAIAQITGRPLV